MPPSQQFWFLGVLFVAMLAGGILPAAGASRRVAFAAFAVAFAARIALDDTIHVV